VTEPADYERIIAELRSNKGKISLRTRFNLARKAFSRTAEYDMAISQYLAEREYGEIEDCYTISNRTKTSRGKVQKQKK
jgi:phosphoribosylaminoimidazolecarboxamide formyltransferase/IMP cyclohydrolase